MMFIEESKANQIPTTASNIISTVGVAPPAITLPASTDMLTGPGGVIGSVLALAAGIFYYRKKYFQDNTDISRSKAESTLIATLIQQADASKKEAIDARNQRTKDAERIATQDAQIESMYSMLLILKNMLKEIAPDRAKLFDDFQQFAPRKDKGKPNDKQATIY